MWEVSIRLLNVSTLLWQERSKKKKKTTHIYACATIPHSEGVYKLFSARLFLLVFSRIWPRRAVSRTEGFEKPGWMICFTHARFAHKTSPSEISE